MIHAGLVGIKFGVHNLFQGERAFVRKQNESNARIRLGGKAGRVVPVWKGFVQVGPEAWHIGYQLNEVMPLVENCSLPAWSPAARLILPFQ